MIIFKKFDLQLLQKQWRKKKIVRIIHLLKELYRKNKRGYSMKSENLRRWTIHIRHLSDVPVSRNWYKTVSKLYQNFHQWQCSIVVTCLWLYHVTSLLHCHWGRFWYNFDTVLYQFLETRASDRCQRLRFSGLIL